MNWDQVEGQWKTLKGSVREHWGKLTEQDYEAIAGKREKLLGKLQERYGMAKERAERELDDFFSSQKSTSWSSGAGATSNSGKSHDPSSITMDMGVKKH